MNDTYKRNQLNKALKNLKNNKQGLPMLRNTKDGINLFTRDKGIEQVMFPDNVTTKLGLIIKDRDRANKKTT